MTQIYQAPCGSLLLEVRGQQLCRCQWCDAETHLADTQMEGISTDKAIMDEAVRQLDEYFKSERCFFNLPLAISGTPFLTKVWQEITAIPYGQTASYKDISRLINLPNGHRAVAMACSRNKMCIVIPCHRVTASRGRLGGYTAVTTGCKRGSNRVGLNIKQYLLEHEAAFARPICDHL